MSEFKKYPSIVRLDKCLDLLSVKEVVATEKIHGTNFRVHFPAGITDINQIEYGGRNEEFGSDSNGFYGGRPVLWFKNQPELLQRMVTTFGSYGFSDVTVFGEAFGTGIQKGVKYAADGEVLFRAFDIMVGTNFLTYDTFVKVCNELGLPRVPEIWRGSPSLEAFDALLDKNSTEGASNGVVLETNIAEGVVIRSNPLLRNVYGEWLIIKHKSDKFSEAASAKRVIPAVVAGDSAAAQVFAETYVTPGRILNVVGHLRDAGVSVKDDMADMKVLAPAMTEDVLKECASEWQDLVAVGATDKQVRGAITKTLGVVYRRFLLTEAVA